METPIKIDDLGVPLFLETPMYSQQRMTFFQNPKDISRTAGCVTRGTRLSSTSGADGFPWVNASS